MATLLVLLAVAVVLRYGLSEPWRARLRRAVMPALLVGGIGFALGFFGPMIFAPGANQGPMLGIFITGPLGFLAGLLWGVGREVLHRDRPR
jgi:4-hydroxybenzoate polyprenyltransferase